MSTKPIVLPAQFAPLEWLGYGVDMTRLDPFDYKSVDILGGGVDPMTRSTPYFWVVEQLRANYRHTPCA